MHQLLLIEREVEREAADRELRLLQALRRAIPASLSTEAAGDYKQREADLLHLLTNG